MAQQRYDYDSFIIKANKKHDGIYEYPWDTDDLDNSFLMKVICPIHGEIGIYPSEHIRIGCWKCDNERHGF